MVYNKFHLFLGKIKFVESSSKIIWEDETIFVCDEFMTFELTLRNKKLKFDIIFDLDASCDFIYEKGDYETPDYYERTNIKINVSITCVESESDIDFDLKDREVCSLLEKFILSNLEL